MTKVRPLFSALILLVVNLAFLGATVWAYGDVGRFFRHPARVGAVVAVLALMLLAMFSGFSGMSAGEKEDRRNRWIFAPLVVLSLGIALVPAYLDGHDLWTTDEAVTPYVGLALLVLGGGLRVAAMYALGRRFSGLVAIQKGHRLTTGGVYRLPVLSAKTCKPWRLGQFSLSAETSALTARRERDDARPFPEKAAPWGALL